MDAKALIGLGMKEGKAIGVALKLLPEAQKAMSPGILQRDLAAVIAEPNAHTEHPHLALLAKALLEQQTPDYVERETPAPYRIWGEGLEPGAVDQIVNAARLPVALRGALMPDAHQGYGLPIGGVLATENAVIPYAVGVDIACRMRLSVYDVPADQMKRLNDQLKRALQRETVFGVGATQRKPVDHEVLDEDWGITGITRRVRDKAAQQIGTSGSGNHFVEFGVLTLEQPDMGLP